MINEWEICCLWNSGIKLSAVLLFLVRFEADACKDLTFSAQATEFPKLTAFTAKSKWVLITLSKWNDGLSFWLLCVHSHVCMCVFLRENTQSCSNIQVNYTNTTCSENYFDPRLGPRVHIKSTFCNIDDIFCHLKWLIRLQDTNIRLVKH